MHTFDCSTGIALRLIFPGKIPKNNIGDTFEWNQQPFFIPPAPWCHRVVEFHRISGYAGVCSRCSICMSVAVLMLFKSHFMIAFHSMCLYVHDPRKTRHKILHGIWKRTQHHKTDEVLNSLLTKTGAAKKVSTLIWSSFGRYVSAKFDLTTETSNEKIM